MRNCVIWCVVLLATAGMAFGKEPKPAEQEKATQEVGAGWKAINDEATALRKQGRYEQAIVAAKKALQVAEQAHGPDHARVAASLNNLAELCRAGGDNVRAELADNWLLAFWEQALGPQHPEMAQMPEISWPGTALKAITRRPSRSISNRWLSQRKRSVRIISLWPRAWTTSRPYTGSKAGMPRPSRPASAAGHQGEGPRPHSSRRGREPGEFGRNL